jgi:hypothetical protein
MGLRKLAFCFSSSILTVAMAGGPPSAAIADDSVAHHGAREQKQHEQKQHQGELVRVVREATRRFRDVNVAEAEGYQLLFGCVSGPDDGAMGLHYVNMALVADGVLDPRRPETVSSTPAVELAVTPHARLAPARSGDSRASESFR